MEAQLTPIPDGKLREIAALIDADLSLQVKLLRGIVEEHEQEIASLSAQITAADRIATAASQAADLLIHALAAYPRVIFTPPTPEDVCP